MERDQPLYNPRNLEKPNIYEQIEDSDSDDDDFFDVHEDRVVMDKDLPQDKRSDPEAVFRGLREQALQQQQKMRYQAPVLDEEQFEILAEWEASE